MRTKTIVRGLVASVLVPATVLIADGAASAWEAYLTASVACPDEPGDPYVVSYTATSWTSGVEGSHDRIEIRYDTEINGSWVVGDVVAFPVQDTVPSVSGSFPVTTDGTRVAVSLWAVGPWGDGEMPANDGFYEYELLQLPTNCFQATSTTSTTVETTTTTIGATSTTTGATSTTVGATSTTEGVLGTSSTATTIGATSTTEQATTTTEDDAVVFPTEQTQVDDGTEVEGVQVQQPQRQALARTGSGGGLVLLGLLAAAGGSAALVSAAQVRRRRA